ncbi:hypothetical protein [Methylorubrum sp. SB2]|uniref:hypothetical protein n=1 Tax=Methylorubrum subtropicum TaxID=3138812 RepID=UPI00313EB686
MHPRVHPAISTLCDPVPETDATDMFSAVRIVSASLIDGGRTMAIRIKKSDANEALILLSPKDAEDLQLRISEALDDPNPP